MEEGRLAVSRRAIEHKTTRNVRTAHLPLVHWILAPIFFLTFCVQDAHPRAQRALSMLRTPSTVRVRTRSPLPFHSWTSEKYVYMAEDDKQSR